jgi:hypothetical protein
VHHVSSCVAKWPRPLAPRKVVAGSAPPQNLCFSSLAHLHSISLEEQLSCYLLSSHSKSEGDRNGGDNNLNHVRIHCCVTCLYIKTMGMMIYIAMALVVACRPGLSSYRI